MRIRMIAGVAVLGMAAAGVAVAQNTADPAPPATPSPCTDLPEPDCAALAGCVWLPGYKVATGATVMGYCRPAPKPLTARRGPGASLPKDPSQ